MQYSPLLFQMTCPKCLTQKLQLDYDNARWNKVCDECYIIVKTRDMKTTVDTWNMSAVCTNPYCYVEFGIWMFRHRVLFIITTYQPIINTDEWTSSYR